MRCNFTIFSRFRSAQVNFQHHILNYFINSRIPIETQQMLHEIETAAGPSANAAYASHSKKYASTHKIMREIYVVPLLRAEKYVNLIVMLWISHPICKHLFKMSKLINYFHLPRSVLKDKLYQVFETFGADRMVELKSIYLLTADMHHAQYGDISDARWVVIMPKSLIFVWFCIWF